MERLQKRLQEFGWIIQFARENKDNFCVIV